MDAVLVVGSNLETKQSSGSQQLAACEDSSVAFSPHKYWRCGDHDVAVGAQYEETRSS